MGRFLGALIAAAAIVAGAPAAAQSDQRPASFLLFDLAVSGPQMRDARGRLGEVHLHSRIALEDGLGGEHMLMLSDVDVAPPTLAPRLMGMADDPFDFTANLDMPKAGGMLFRVRAYFDTDRAVEPFVGLDGGSRPYSLGQAAMKDAGGNVSVTNCLAGLSYSLGAGTAGTLAYRYSRRKDAMFGGEGRTQFDSIYDSHGVELALRLRF